MPSDMQPSDTQPRAAARYGDGLSAMRVAADVRLETEGLVFQFPGVPATLWSYADLRTAQPIHGRAVDAILMSRKADRASLFIDDTQLLAQLLKHAPHLKLANERWRTVRPGLAVGTLALAAAAAIWSFDLSPSKGLASAMPEKARASLGEHVIRTMPAKARCTNVEGRRALTVLVRRLMPNGPITGDTVTVLDWPLLNAFAVPGNRIVLTRGLIEAARSPDEIAAVIGHEAGHVAELHPEASLVRSVGFWALVQMLFTGTPGAIGNIGTVIAQLGYTRSAERAADDHALRLLRNAGISPVGMADFFRRMEARASSPAQRQTGVGNDIFSSHPSNAERIRGIENQASYNATPAMSAEDWQALKSICGPAAAVPIETVNAPAAKAAAEAKRIADIKAAADKKAADEALAEANRVLAAKQAAEAKAAADKEVADQLAAEAKRVTDAKRDAEAKAVVPPVGQSVEAVQKVAAATEPAQPLSAVDARIEAANKRIASNVQDAGAYFERGQAFAAKRQAAAAIEDFSRALAIQPTDVPVLFWRASQYAAQKQFDLAIADYTDVLRTQPKNYAALNNRGSIYRSQKKLDLAIKDFTAAIAIDSKQPMALTNRALAHRDRSELDAAVVDLTAVLSTNPKSASALVRRGETLELKAAKDAAIADYRAALALPEPAGAPSEPHKTARARLLALGVATP